MKRVLCTVMAVLLLLPLCFTFAFADGVSATVTEPIKGTVGEEMNQTVQLVLNGVDWIGDWDKLNFQFGAASFPEGITVTKGTEKSTFIVSGTPKVAVTGTATITIPANVLKVAGSDPAEPIVNPVIVEVEWDIKEKEEEQKQETPKEAEEQPKQAETEPKQEEAVPAPKLPETTYPTRNVSFTVVAGKGATFSDGSTGTKTVSTEAIDGKVADANVPKLNILGGYTFNGWKDSNGTIIDLATYTPGTDVELTADCTAAPVSASFSTVTVKGVVGSQIAETNVIITLANDEWSASLTDGLDVSSWFTNLPSGLAVRAVANGASSYFVVYGTPATVSTEQIQAKIPATYLQNSSAEITVQPGTHAVYSILQAGIRVTGIKFNISGVEFKRTGTSYKPSYTITPSDASVQDVTFWSDNTNVAAVETDGTIYSVGAGTTNVWVQTLDGNYQASLPVTVYGTPTDMTLSASIVKGDHSSIAYLKADEQMAVTLYVKNPTASGVRWHASSGRIRLSDTATYLTYDNSTGMYTSTIYVDPRYNGSVSIYASVGDRKTDKLKFTVKGLSNYPVTGQNDWPLYIMVTVAVLTAGGLVFAYAKRRKNNAEQ